MNKLLKRKQLLAGAGLVALGVVIGLAGLLLAVMPQTSKAKSLDAEIQAAQTKLASLKGPGQHGPTIKAADLFQLVRAMPSDPDMPGLLIELSNLASRAKISVTQLTPAAPIVQPDGSSAWPLHITASGTWPDVTKFLRELRDEVHVSKTKLQVNGRVFVIDNLQVNGRSDGSDLLDVSMTVNAFTYGVVAPAAPATGTDTTSTTTTPAPGSTQAAGSTGSTG